MEGDDSVMRMPQSVIDRERYLRRLNEELDRDAGTASTAAFKPSTQGQTTLFDSADELTADDREYAKQLLRAVDASTLSNDASNSGHATFGKHHSATGRHATEEYRESAASEQARRKYSSEVPSSAIPKPRAGGARRLRVAKQRGDGGYGVPDRPRRSDRSDKGSDPDSSGTKAHTRESRGATSVASSRYASSKRTVKRAEGSSSTRPASAGTRHTGDQGRAAAPRPPLQLHPDVPPETAVRLLQAEAEALRGDVREATTARLAATRRLKDVTSAAREARRDADALRKRLEASEAARRRASEEAERLRQRAGQATTEAKSMEQAAREQRKAASGGDRERYLLETRLRRKTEECEALREQLKQEQERRKRSVHDATEGVDALRRQVRVLERQRAHLMEGFKRQMRLIDLLKQQRMHLEAVRALEFTEIEFARALDSGSLPMGERVWTVEEASKAAGAYRGKGAAGRGGVAKGASHGSGRLYSSRGRGAGGRPVPGGRRPGSSGGQQRGGGGRG